MVCFKKSLLKFRKQIIASSLLKQIKLNENRKRSHNSNFKVSTTPPPRGQFLTKGSGHSTAKTGKCQSIIVNEPQTSVRANSTLNSKNQTFMPVDRNPRGTSNQTELGSFSRGKKTEAMTSHINGTPISSTSLFEHKEQLKAQQPSPPGSNGSSSP